jgi:hypothetical protein
MVEQRARTWLLAGVHQTFAVLRKNMHMEGPWTVVGTLAAVIGTAVIIYSVAIQPKLRRLNVKRPCIAWFEIPRSSQREVKYAVQDDREHSVHELTLPAHSEVQIEILYRSKVSFTAANIYFGCGDQDYRDLDRKPEITSVRYPFIAVGITKETPESHPETNAIDRHKFYHLRRPKNITNDETYSLGCEMRTREAGRYKFKIFFVSEEVGTTQNKLYIRVENAPSTNMKCVDHPSCYITPRERI